MEALEDGFEEDGGIQPRGADLQQEQVGVHHRVREVTLDVGHRLAPDLEPVPDPHLAHYLIKCNLNIKIMHICL